MVVFGIPHFQLFLVPAFISTGLFIFFRPIFVPFLLGVGGIYSGYVGFNRGFRFRRKRF